ncbi:hypothetical protein METBIDRAFT_37525 [Metschnikowia bicuspidata var. bicuspidata NRRL YB-4993]|uniref:Thioesterase domain-containing protein n=1 Tax=Metschnikowia bicuspidata var. bicuspidata NRRL YB-4993 TaxID=869754 RepID=A0A1A0HKE6_9ASCO|nr:hypothetical protein METBIDRAFT_37525 [Metschnikowia bicuspidata var. bicuspidata NRRL YB-4993]OBA24362.1 hypothetical protein METBIDRAFT_37525 [Metschnikowia bicuspidata var. bicuspidata NRRL YB-4993]
MSRLRTFTRVTSPLAAFAAGFLVFPQEWQRGRWEHRHLSYMNKEAVQRIENSEMFKALEADKDTVMSRSSDAFPAQHRKNHVGLGLMAGLGLMEVDPIIFTNSTAGELTAFYHLGKNLISADGQIHNGVTATILDEALCLCGFSQLPSKRGVTANLTIDFHNQAPPESTVVVRAKVVEAKGRKVVIHGTLFTMNSGAGPNVDIASAKCVLVEPKWLKYFWWVPV